MKCTVVHLDQDDPKKCTARKLSRHGFVRLVEHQRRLAHGAVLLDPFSERAFSPQDRTTIEKVGLVALDCSWKRARTSFEEARKGLSPRALPYLLAANPVSYGNPGRLSTAEAIAAAASIAGLEEDAERMLSLWKWGPQFLKLNAEPLEAYRACASSAQIVEVMKEFMPR